MTGTSARRYAELDLLSLQDLLVFTCHSLWTSTEPKPLQDKVKKYRWYTWKNECGNRVRMGEGMGAGSTLRGSSWGWSQEKLSRIDSRQQNTTILLWHLGNTLFVLIFPIIFSFTVKSSELKLQCSFILISNWFFWNLYFRLEDSLSSWIWSPWKTTWDCSQGRVTGFNTT